MPAKMIKPNRSPLPALLVGCAGWTIPSKNGPSFPGEGSHLERFAKVLSCAEINSTFYRSHQEKTYLRWAGSVPEAFRFSVKMPRTITHELRLQRCEIPLRAFLGEVAALGGKLGCILVQLPPSLALDEKVAKKFFSLLRKHTRVPVACEPRHASWFTPEGMSVLDGASVSRVLADPLPVPVSVLQHDMEMLYIRLHGAPRVYYSAYDAEFIEGIATGMRMAREEGRVAWCIFDNTAGGEAVPNALMLIKKLSEGG